MREIRQSGFASNSCKDFKRPERFCAGNCIPYHVYEDAVLKNQGLKAKVKELEKLCWQAEIVIGQHRKEVADLKLENEVLHLQIKQLEGKLNREKRKPFVPRHPSSLVQELPTEDNTAQQKLFQLQAAAQAKWADLKGHVGHSRIKPVQPDEVVEVCVSKCTYCGSENVTQTNDVREHIQEDIQIKRFAMLYKHRGAYCKKCRKVSFGTGVDEIEKSDIGPKARTAAITMQQEGVPTDKISRLLDQIFDLDVSASSICGWYNKAAAQAAPIYDLIKRKVQVSESIHADETGWFVDRQRGWLWCFTNYRLCLFVIDHSRASKVAKDVIGEYYYGTLMSDFYSAYNVIKAVSKQKCHSHLLRMADEVLVQQGLLAQDRQVAGKVKELIKQAIDQYHLYKDGQIDAKRLSELGAAIKCELMACASIQVVNKDAVNLCKLILKRDQELFVFMNKPDHVEPTNNRAERALRPMVIMRKNSYGNVSNEGAKNIAVIGSLVQTAKLNGSRVYDVIHSLVTSENIQRLRELVFGKQIDYVQLRFPFLYDLLKADGERSPPS